MLNFIGLLALIYVAFRGRKQLGTEVWCVIFAFTVYFTYSYIWSILTIAYFRQNLHGSVSNFSYSLGNVTSAYLLCMSGVAISLATCAYLSGFQKPQFITKAFGRFRVDTAFFFFAILSCYGLFTLVKNYYVYGSLAEVVRNRYASDPVGIACENLFGIPFAIAVMTGKKRQLQVGGTLFGVVLLAGLTSGRTTFLAVGIAPVLICYAAKNVTSLHWRGILRAFGAALAVLLLLQLYRTMRNLGEGGAETKSLQIQNSFTEILVLSRVVEKTTLGHSYVGIEPVKVPFYMMVPTAWGGTEKQYYFTHWKPDHYVSRTFFDSIANMPITIYGDGFLMFGTIGVLIMGVLVGCVLYLSVVCFRIPGGGGIIVGLICIGATLYSARQGITEFTFTLVTGILAMSFIHGVDTLVRPEV